ncbi:cytochrome P450 [Crepidotus variabilis]|uniref:Cytochrome P450 n=1 Tax=Crepidotus variabilis TaxID=179855 RepID=A0A9P6JMW9_9AGAR|nr:cytochrome P450 [Crepidotus variabilis]
MDRLLLSDRFHGAALAVFVVLLVRVLSSWFNKQKYPPGPRPWPIIGNAFDIPKEEAWVTYANWKHKYGDIVYMNVVGTPMVILNSYQDCVNLFEKRSEIYSDRHQLIVASTLMGWDNAITLCPYGDKWRKYRKICAQSMKREVVKQFQPVQEKGAVHYLKMLLDDPSNFKSNFRFAATRSIMWNMYGVEITDPKDIIVGTTEEAVKYALQAAMPGNFLVDFFPPLLHLPEWLPGMAFKKWARKGRKLTQDMLDLPYNVTVKDLEEGNPNTSFTAIALEKGKDVDIIKWCSGTVFSAAVDTSVATMQIFFLAMTLHQECQKRAQQEIDAVCGNGRLPSLEDRERLPYVEALMKEVLRWQPVVPMALPHRLMQDDVYNDLFLPAGSIVLGNSWAISRDPDLFENADSFIPERYLPQDGKVLPLDPLKFAFGYGRRICAGIHYAENMMFITMSRILAAFNIKPPLDESGNDILPEAKFESLLVREVVPFACSIKPRSQAAQALIHTSLA